MIFAKASLLFKHFKNEDKLLTNLKDIFEILKDYIEDETKQENILEFILYIMLISEIPEDSLVKIINNVTKNGGDAIMTTAMRIKIEGKLEDAKNLKKLGVSIDIIAKGTGLSKVQIENL